MKLQGKLISAFGVLAAITLLVSLLAIWQVRQLSTALYEIGVVRLPSIQGLEMMHDAMVELDASGRAMAGAGGAAALPDESVRQQGAWGRFAVGWNLYEPLPQTDEEALIWRSYVPTARAWQAGYRSDLAAIAAALASGDPGRIAAAQGRLAESEKAAFAPTARLLADLIALNYRVVDDTKQRSIVSQRDVTRLSTLVLLLAAASIIGNVAIGIVVARRLSRPVVAVADALSRVAAGDLSVRVDVSSHDEIGQMTRAMNKMLENLSASDARLRLLGDNLPESMIYQVERQDDGTMRFLYVSAGVERLHGHKAEAVLLDASLVYDQIYEPDRAAIAAAEAASFAAMDTFNVIARVKGIDGSLRWVNLSSRPRKKADGRVVWDGIETDITSRIHSVEELRRANRALRTLSACNRVLVRAGDEGEILREICRVVVEEGGYRFAWVGFVEHDEGKTVRPVAYAGPGKGYFANLKVTWADTPLGRGPTGTAIRTGVSVLCRDFELDPRTELWRDEAIRHGLRSSLVFPLSHNGAVFGALSIYSEDPDAFDEHESDLLSELAEDLAFGVSAQRARIERERIEAERERLARAIDGHYDGAYWLDTDNRIVYVNETACRALGRTREELIGSLISIVNPGATPERMAEVWRRLRAGGSYTAESEHHRKDGSTFPVEIVSTHVTVGGGEFNCGFARDISGRRKAEKELRESERKFSKMFQGAPVLIGISDLESGIVLDANEEVFRVTGFRREEMIGRRAVDIGFISAEDRARIGDEVREHGRIPGMAMSFKGKDGRTIHGLVNGDRIEIDGQVCLLLIIADISARKQAEESLEAAADRLALALRASKFGVWRHNLQTRASEWDDRMFEIFGLPAAAKAPGVEEILERVAEEDRGAVRKSWGALPSCDHSYRSRFRVRRPDGSMRHVELQGIVRDDGMGRPEWSIGVAGDITEIIQATTEAERLRAQLNQSQKMEALGNLAAGVAHDFNNLLTGINGFVELASTSLAPGHEASELLMQARRGAMSARDLVRRILNFSRSNSDQKRVLVDSVEVIRDTAPLIAAALPANVSLSLDLGCKTAMVLADSGQLQQVLMNLCTNAAHAIGSRAGTIRIGAKVCELGGPGGRQALPRGCSEGPHLLLSVRDSGSGMDEVTRMRIFEPFFTTKRRGEGTGLGLSIVRDIVAAHEGGVEVESAPGTGTTFTIFMPLTRSLADPRQLADRVQQGRGSGQKVLVVDDEPSVGTIARMILQKSGYAPEPYTSPNDAWKRFEASPGSWDLLIVDQNMPEITGSEFVSRARMISPALPIVMMSGRFENDGFLPGKGIVQLKKPFEIAELTAAVKAALNPSAQPAHQS